jgi:hypothetical protein
MAKTSNSATALRGGDSVLRFLIDGGSWADAVEMEYSLTVPVLEAQLKAAVKKQNPSGERYRAKLLGELREAYSFMGKSPDRANAFLEAELDAYFAEKGVSRPAPKVVAPAAPVMATPTRASMPAKASRAPWARRPPLANEGAPQKRPVAAPATPVRPPPVPRTPAAPVKAPKPNNRWAALGDSDSE